MNIHCVSDVHKVKRAGEKCQKCLWYSLNGQPGQAVQDLSCVSLPGEENEKGMNIYYMQGLT